MEKKINCFDRIFSISKFTNFESVLSFDKDFNIVDIIKELNKNLFNLNENEFYDYLEIISLTCNHIDLLIASLAPYSYKDKAYFLQERLNLLRKYLEMIPESKKKFSQYIEILKKKRIKEEKDIHKIIQKANLIEINQQANINNNLNNNNIKIKEKPSQQEEIKTVEKPIIQEVEQNFLDISLKNEEEKISSNNETLLLENREEENKEDEQNKNKLKLEEIKARIEKRNKLIQTLLDIYHEKKNGYKLMLNLFRGLDIYRRMSLTCENFDKNLFIRNFKKYLTFFKDANLIQLCIEKNKELDEETVKKMIVDCLKIINKQIDKSRFKIFFSDKLNYRSGFNEEFQQKVRWLYFPERRRPKRNIDELYSIKSVTKVTDHLSKIKGFKSYISLLSKRDIDIINQLLPILHKIYYKNTTVRTFLINIFYSIDKYEYSLHELTEEKKNKFKENLKNLILNTSIAENKPSLFKIMIDLNPKVNPNDIRNLLPICINIMKEKIDIGFERRKKEFPVLANSFNPLEKYYQIYDKKLFLIYKRI